MSIYSKLLEIQKKVDKLSKDSQGHNYNYVSGSKVLEAIKPIMNELGVLLKPEVLSIENERQDYEVWNKFEKEFRTKSEILSKVKMRFTWIEVETGETDVCEWGANGQNDWDKGVGSAMTYGERYFLLKYFHINTDEDDVDNPKRKSNSESTNQSGATSGADSSGNPTKWLNKTISKDSPETTKEWDNIVKGIEKGTVNSVQDVRKHYKVSKAIQAELDLVLIQNKK